jgi:23S rRNA (uridine2552-2'-O)-methyltransferase
VSGKIERNKKNKSNKAWITEHVNDAYVQRARAEGWRSRAAFKLTEIDDKDKLLKPGMTVVDLGSAPGSWSQVAARRIAPGGRLIALDLLPMDDLHGVEFIQGDFRDDAVLAALVATLGERQVDLVLSDMAPNMSGIAVVDQARVMLLAELTLEFCGLHLKPGGGMLVKVFQGDGFMELRGALQQQFETLQMRKPAASRNRSAEIYLLARGKRAGVAAGAVCS